MALWKQSFEIVSLSNPDGLRFHQSSLCSLHLGIRGCSSWNPGGSEKELDLHLDLEPAIWWLQASYLIVDFPSIYGKRTLATLQCDYKGEMRKWT